jgi:hypothetical protein
MFDLVAAKARLNITDNLKDAQVMAILGSTLLWAESYCRRKFTVSQQTETFNYFAGSSFPLLRYPVRTVASVRVNGNVVSDYALIRQIGLVEIQPGFGARKVEIDYVGGYPPDEFPADLELALWAIFDYLWAQTPGAGIAAGGGGGGVSAGGMKSFSSPGVISINYDESTKGNTSGGAHISSGAMMPPLAMTILDLYRRELA